MMMVERLIKSVYYHNSDTLLTNTYKRVYVIKFFILVREKRQVMKNIVITGGSSGVGLAIARDLYEENHLILIGKNREKLLNVSNQLNHKVDIIAADLSTSEGIESANLQIRKSFSKVDVLINSAGIMPATASDNIATNLKSHYELTMKLKDLLTQGRVLLVSGNPRAIRVMPICEIQNNHMTRAAWVVTHKTLLMILLADALKKQATTVNSFFPGDVQSNLMPFTRNLNNQSVPVGKYLAIDSSVSDFTGYFFDEKGQIVSLDDQKYNLTKANSILVQYLS